MVENNEVAEVAVASTGDSVAENGNAVQQNAQGQPAQPRQGMWGIIKGLLIRMVIIYMISSFFRRGSTPEAPTDGSTTPTQGYVYTTNQFPKGTYMDMYVYISEDETFTDFENEDLLFWAQKGLAYGDWEAGPNADGTFVFSGTVKASEAVQNNGSIYLHAYMVKERKSPDPNNRGKYSKRNTVYRSLRLNKYKKRKFHQTVNLLTGQTDAHPDMIKKPNSSNFEILSNWHPNLTINLIDDQTSWVKGSIPAPLDEYVDFIPETNKYYPVLYFNSYWNMNSDYQPINDTTKELSLTVTYSPISLFRWQMYAAQGMKNKWSSMLGTELDQDDGDQDTLKTAFLETNPYLLGLTIVISIVHSVFEFLAFKNDIQFWRSRKSLEGLSVRSVFFNVFQSLIVLLYVIDNETNTVVMISVGVGLLIELWKIHKVVDVKIDRDNPLFGSIPRIWLEDKSTYTQSLTKKYDMLAFKYLSWLLFPLLAGYSVYSLVYQEQRGWYSWVLSMLYGFLLMFGFIMMTPQLFINYKLKSVAHLPWRMLTYKALNTFIDDIFAFVIKMPTLYRIGCLRDDVIFFVFLYQRYVYRMDPTRVNEFGVSQEMLEKVAEDKAKVKAVEGAEPNGDTVRAITDGDIPPTEKGDNSTCVSPQPVDTELPPPKPADEKKND